MADGVEVRRARPEDAPAIAPLVYSTAAGMYDLVLGDRERSLRFVEASLGDARDELVWVAERGGELASVLVGFRAQDEAALARRFLLATLRRRPPWRWPGILRLHWLGERHAPRPVPDSFYLDALATAPAHRRAGVASALLAKAEAHARSCGMPALSVDTTESNEGARALYRAAGFEEVRVLRSPPPIPPAVELVKRLG